jgi:UDP-GlcNAc3NAcA epimerase
LKTILHIVGNRPQFIKLAVLYNHIAAAGNIPQQIIHTGQHFSVNMSAIFFEELNIPEPTINFNIQAASQNVFIANATDALEQYFTANKNCVAFVYGDTNTTLAAAIAAKRTNTKLIHFEAGVRTYDNSMPEEINRIITDRLADINYCCTQKNMDTLLAEGYGNSIPTEILLTGDLMLDAFNNITASNETITTEKNYIACTVHRAANLASKENLSIIINALNELHKTVPVLMPVHPHTAKKIAEYNLQPSFTILPPLGYPAMKKLIQDAAYVITDSGGTSREAYFCKKKSLILMDTPFWPEILEANCSMNTIVEANTIIQDFEAMQKLEADFEGAIFGNGKAAHNILTHLNAYL